MQRGKGGGLSQAAVSLGRGHSRRCSGPWTVKDGWALLPPSGGLGASRAGPRTPPGSPGDAGLDAPRNVEVFGTIFCRSGSR